MRFLSVSDLHIDYTENREWLFDLSRVDYQNDVLILGGDITDNWALLARALTFLKDQFHEVCFVPGNHDLWIRKENGQTSLEKFHRILDFCEKQEIHTAPLRLEKVSILPFYSWYDYSFGEPSPFLLSAWNDFTACRWSENLTPPEISELFLGLNRPARAFEKDCFTISFSHFLPRIDLMPSYIPENKRFIYPVLGSERLGRQLDDISPDIHVYGHSHVNQIIKIGKTTYLNNAYGYPQEKNFTRKELICLHEC